MSEPKRYSVDEANALLPELRERLIRLREARRRLIASSQRITARVAADGGGVGGSDWFEIQRELKTEILWLAERRVALRDPEAGLVDFPGERDGQDVWLCWRLGEDEVAWWHELDTGFIGRKPL
ncbi:MAG: DUF2203 domain-containing protein [Actinobacteria bacterium]|nr:DUF2203 domain-containing protein [Actinomycetota bacterium]